MLSSCGGETVCEQKGTCTMLLIPFMHFMHRMNKYVYVSCVPHFSTLRKIPIQNVFNLHKECDQLVAQYYFLAVVNLSCGLFVVLSNNTVNWCSNNHVIMFLGMFTKLQKVTISFVMSVRPVGATCFPLDRFSWNFIFENF